MVQVVAVVTRLICNDFFCHHSISQVVTAVQVVTGSNAEGGDREDRSPNARC